MFTRANAFTNQFQAKQGKNEHFFLSMAVSHWSESFLSIPSFWKLNSIFIYYVMSKKFILSENSDTDFPFERYSNNYQSLNRWKCAANAFTNKFQANRKKNEIKEISEHGSFLLDKIVSLNSLLYKKQIPFQNIHPWANNLFSRKPAIRILYSTLSD